MPGAGSVAEGNAGTTNLVVPVSLTFPSTSAVSARWSTEFISHGSAIDEAQPDVDYTPVSGAVSFAPGTTTATVTIPVHGDTIPEGDEYVVVAFGSPVSATIGGFYGLGFGTITNDDFAVVDPGGASIPEGQAGTSDLELPVTLSKPAAVPVTVQWNTLFVEGASAVQATPGVDYTPASGTVAFAPGETAKTVTISVIGDQEVEPGQWIVVSFHTPTGPGRVGGYYGFGFGFIANDD